MSTHSSSNISDSSSSKDALMELLSPDGYYTYLGVPKPPPSTTPATTPHSLSSSSSSSSKQQAPSEVDEDVVKKNYRKLSLRHHPDKGGDVDTFRVLNRAQKVLTNPKLRQQYDILGIDLDDDEEEQHHANDDHHDADEKEQQTVQGGIIQEIASNVLTGVIQVGVRTNMMGAVSVLLVRYWFLFYPALAFLAFIGFRIVQTLSSTQGGSVYDTIPPTLIATGLCIMYSAAGDEWNKQFWLGETIVIGLFVYNSLGIPELQRNLFVVLAVAVFALLAALGLRGKFWNYAIVVGFVAVLAVLVAVAFPIMELLLEAIINEKLKKVGDKVRHHHQILQKHYEQKAN